MRAVVVGGGVIGTTSAYALLRRGVDVTLIDGGWSAGVATTVNAGLVTPGHALSWSSPAMLARLPAVLANRTPQLRIRAHLDPDLLRWGVRFLRHCTRAAASRSSLLRATLGQRSRAALLRALEELAIDCGQQHGLLFVHSDEAALLRAHEALHELRRAGCDLRLVDHEECVALEPALGRSELPIAGAVHHPTGLSADCAAFTTGLREWCRDHGATVLDSTEVVGLSEHRGRTSAAVTRAGEEIAGDVFVVAAGARSGPVLGRAGKRLRLYPVRGYGLTWHGLDERGGPTLGGIDETNLVAWSRAGSSLRVTGIAEFARAQRPPHPEDQALVRDHALRLFPRLRDAAPPHVGAGHRPMTPDGLPRIGRFLEPNVYVNTGHGNLGWTMACGAAELLADAVTDSSSDDPLATGLAP